MSRLRAGGLALAFIQVSGTAQVSAEGCWDTALGSWYPVPETQFSPAHAAPPPDMHVDSIYYAVPPRIRLDRTPFADREGQYVVTIPEDALQTLHSMRWWSVDGDSLFVNLTTGFAGVRARLGRAGAAWAGTVRTYSDVAGRLRHERPIRLVPARCSDPPPIPASADRWLPRAVDLADGPVVELGETLPEGLRTSARRSGATTVDGTVVGEFAGADTLIVRVARNGLVSRIDLIYSPAFDFAGLMASLGARFGNSEQRASPGTFGWTNRTSQILAVASHDGAAPHRLILIDPRQGY